MNETPHRIRSLRWQVEAGSTAEAFAWRTMLRQKGMELVVPVLDQEFAAIAPTEQVVHIPRLELRLRLQHPEELETLLPGEIRRLLGEQLRHFHADGDLAGPAANGVAGTMPERVPAPKERALGPNAGRTPLHNLLRYLQTGLLPWAAAVGSAQEQAAALGETSRTFLPQLLQHLALCQETAEFYFRLLQLLPWEACGLLVRERTAALPGERGAALRQGLELLLDGGGGFSRFARLKLLAAILATTRPWRTVPGGSWTLRQAAATAVPPGEQQLLAQWIAALPHPVAVLFRSEDTATTIRNDGYPTAKDVEERSDPPTGLQPREMGSTKECRRPGVLDTAPGPAKSPNLAPSSPPETSDALFPLLVQQAGLILLHPYLVRFFEHNGVKEAGSKELLPSALPRAAALLHFLATGRDECYEYELGLVKILLGLHPQTELPVCTGLMAASDQVEAEALLQAMIGHWSILKNTSIPGLRASFLERPGLLRDEENGWRLKVERKAYDLLLEQIPWSIGIVRLPWMARPLFIEW